MNSHTKLLSAVLAVGSLLLLSGCAKYNAISLPRLTSHADKSENYKNKNVILEHKVFTKQDCATYLGRKNVLKKGFQPVQLTLTNTTDRSYTYSSSTLSLQTVPTELVAKKVKFSTAGRVVGYSAAAAACAASLAAIIVCVPCSCPLWVPLIFLPSGPATLSFSAAAIIDGIKSSKENKELMVDFNTKSFPQEGTLKPYQTINGIVFVPKKLFRNDFTFTLNDDRDKTVVLHSISDPIDVK